jgi:hypothetical protein
MTECQKPQNEKPDYREKWTGKYQCVKQREEMLNSGQILTYNTDADVITVTMDADKDSIMFIDDDYYYHFPESYTGYHIKVFETGKMNPIFNLPNTNSAKWIDGHFKGDSIYIEHEFIPVMSPHATLKIHTVYRGKKLK